MNATKGVSCRNQALLILFLGYVYRSQRNLLALKMRHCPNTNKEPRILPENYFWRIPKTAKSNQDHVKEKEDGGGGGDDVGVVNAEGEKEKTGDEDEASVIPKLHWLPGAFQYLSTCVQLINMALIGSVKFGFIEAHGVIRCEYMPVAVVHHSIPAESMLWLSGTFSCMILIWRVISKLYGLTFTLDAFAFLISDQFHSQLASSNLPKSFVRLFTDYPSTTTCRCGPHHLDFFESILYYKQVDWRTHRVKYQLRPNRTLEARRELAGVLSMSLIGVSFIILLGGLFLVPSGLYLLFLDHRFHYPNCNNLTSPLALNWSQSITLAVYWRRLVSSLLLTLVMVLDVSGALAFGGPFVGLLASDLLICWRDVRARLDRLCSLMIQYNELAQIPITANSTLAPIKETGGCSKWSDDDNMDRSLVLVATVKDNSFFLHRYYNSRHSRQYQPQNRWLELSGEGSTHHWRRHDLNYIISNSSSIINSSDMSLGVRANHLPRDEVYRATRLKTGQLHWVGIDELGEIIDNEYLAFKAILIDFMSQVQSADKFMSMTLTLGLAIWFSFNSLLTIEGHQVATKASGMLVIRLFQCVALALLATVTYYIVLLQAEAGPAYADLCSLVAREQTTDKERWLPLLAYYTGGAGIKPGFTLWLTGGELYTRLTILKIISYTFSLMFLYETYRYPAHHQ